MSTHTIADLPALFPGLLIRRALWVVFLLAWTVALVVPVFVFPPSLAHGSVATIPLGKILHVSCYAGLAATVPAIVRRWRSAWGVLLALSLHTIATELIQAFVPTRGPSLFDVGLDHIGLTVGVLLTWPSWNVVWRSFTVTGR
jgi:VanZ family protein